MVILILRIPGSVNGEFIFTIARGATSTSAMAWEIPKMKEIPKQRTFCLRQHHLSINRVVATQIHQVIQLEGGTEAHLLRVQILKMKKPRPRDKVTFPKSHRKLMA